MMYNAIDASPSGPVENNQTYMMILICIFIMIGSIFCVNLFVAIVNLKFVTAQREHMQKNLTQEQQQWIKIVTNLISKN